MSLSVVLFACNAPKVGEPQPAVSDNITISLANQVPGSSDHFNVVVSTAADVDSLVLCAGNSLEACKPGAPVYVRASLIQGGSRKFFSFSAPIRLEQVARLVLVGQNSLGEVAAARAVEIIAPGAAPSGQGGSAAPGQGNSSTTVGDPSGGSNSPPTGLQPSGGSGGQTGSVNNRFRADNDLQGLYQLYVPEGVTAPLKALVYFHGDGNSNYELIFRGGELNAFAQEQGMILASLRTPSQGSWSNPAPERHADYVHQLLQNELFRQYNIDRSQIYFIGQSGGAIFLSRDFVSKYGENYGGGFLFFCGGDPPGDRSFAASENMKKNLQIYVHATSGDFLIDRIRRADQSYRQLGFRVDASMDDPGQHCAFQQHPIIRSKIPEMIARRSSV